MVVKQFRSAGPMTLNNFTEDELAHLRSVATDEKSKVKYITFCHEVGEKETKHLQIYAQSNTKLSIKGWHEQLGKRIANIEPTVDQEKAIKYCQGFLWNEEKSQFEPKPGSGEFEEYGKRPRPGERTDLIGFKRRIEQGETVLEVAQSDDMFGIFARNRQALKEYGNFVEAKRERDEARENLKAFTASRKSTLHWEGHLHSVLFDESGCLRPAHARKIYWYFDAIGDTYKTVNAKMLLFNHSTYLITGGRCQDIYYAYKYQKIIVYNQCASQNPESAQHMYKVLEEFKDGYFLSTKYETKEFIFSPKHVIVLANTEPDFVKLKTARILAVDIQKYETSAHYRAQIAHEDSSA
jgi:hypothetical protein